MQGFVLGAGPFVLVLLSFGFDWIRIAMLAGFARLSGLEAVSVHPFNIGKQVQALRKILPEGALRKKVKLLEICSILCWFGFCGLILLSTFKK